MELDIFDNETTDFKRLYVEHRFRFVRFANSYLRDWAASEDIVTDAMMQYWERRAELKPGSNVPAYILATVRNLCLNHLRHAVVRDDYSQAVKDYYEWDLNTRISTLEACDPSELYSGELQELIDHTFGMLAPKTREMFQLSRVDGRTFAEIADICGVSVKTVEYHIGKALKLFHRELKNYFPIFLFFYLG